MILLSKEFSSPPESLAEDSDAYKLRRGRIKLLTIKTHVRFRLQT